MRIMNFLTILLNSIVGFIRHNPLTCLFLAVLAVACPPLFGFMLGAVIVLVVLSLLGGLLFLWRLKRAQRDLENEIRQRQSGFYGSPDNGSGTTGSRNEGDVSVHRTNGAPAKKISDDVGEYVDFEEEVGNKNKE